MNGTYEDKSKYYRSSQKEEGSKPQQPYLGPENPGPPASMRKALAKKSSTGGSGPGLPNKNTSAAGSVR